MKMSEWCNLTPAVRCHAVNTPFMPSLLRKLQPIFFLEGGGHSGDHSFHWGSGHLEQELRLIYKTVVVVYHRSPVCIHGVVRIRCVRQ